MRSIKCQFFPPIDPGFWVVSEDEVSDLESYESGQNDSSEVDEVSVEISEEASEQKSVEESESECSEEESLESEEVSEEEDSDNDVEVMEILEKIETQNLNHKQADNLNNAQKDNVSTVRVIAENGTAEKMVSSATRSEETVCIRIG